MTRLIYFASTIRFTLIALLIFGFASVQSAEAFEYPWNDHAEPYDFLFGNHIDSHQQTKEKRNGDLSGYLYITFTGDEKNGIGIAKHCGNDTPAKACVVGWAIKGKSGEATAVYHDDDKNDHPLWLVESRNDIPQPGPYSHFHWLGKPKNAKKLKIGKIYYGYFLKLRAVKTFYFEHGGEKILIRRGIDIASHVNVVASFPGY